MSLMNFLTRCFFTFFYSFALSEFITKLMFEPKTYSYNISYIGLALVLFPFSYTTLHKVFGHRIILVDKEEFAKELEKKLKQKLEENED